VITLTHPTAGEIQITRHPRRPDWSDGWLQPQPVTASGAAVGAEPVRAIEAATLEWPGLSAAEAMALTSWHIEAALGQVTISGLVSTDLTALLGGLDIVEVTPDTWRVTMQIEVLP
jgi:hypothetical protein